MADVYRALWRHKWFILLLTGALVAATWLLTSRQQKTYEASTLVRIQQRIQDPGQALGALETGQRLAQTYARIITTTTVARRIHDDLGGAVPYKDIKVSASPVQDLELVSISARSPSPRNAQLVANAAPPALRRFIADTGTLRDQVITVEPAERPTSPASPRLKLNLAVALMFGLVFNGALALLLEVLSDRLPAPDELERLTRHPILSTIPTIRFGRLARTETARAEPQDPLAVPEVVSTPAAGTKEGGVVPTVPSG